MRNGEEKESDRNAVQTPALASLLRNVDQKEGAC